MIKEKLHTIVRFLTNPHTLICYGIAWIITNGWSYLALVVGLMCRWKWLYGVAGTYLTILWIPGTPEKLVTALIALWLLRRLYPRDVQDNEDNT